MFSECYSGFRLNLNGNRWYLMEYLRLVCNIYSVGWKVNTLYETLASKFSYILCRHALL